MDINEIISAVSGLEGGADLAESLRTHAAHSAATLDDLKGKYNAASTGLKEASGERDKYKSDFEAASGSSDEAIKNLTAARDAAVAERDSATQGLVQYKTKQAVMGALRAKGLKGSALDDATALFVLPEGAVLEGDSLAGATSAINAFVKARPHLLGSPQGNGGGRSGSGEPAGGQRKAVNPDTQAKQEYDSFRKELEDMHDANIPAAYRQTQ